MRRLEEVVGQLENWFALRNSVELDDLCLEVGWSGEKLFVVKVWRRVCSNSQLNLQVGLSRRQVHAWLRRRRTSQPQPQAVDVISTSPASNIEVIF